MAGIFKTIGSTLSAVDTLASSGSRRLAVWAREQETQTKYRHVGAMLKIKTDCAKDLSSEIERYENEIKNPSVAKAVAMLEALDQNEAEA